MDVLLFGSPIALWQVLLSVGVLFAIAEIFSPGFVLLPIGVALCLSAPVSLFVTSWFPFLIVMSLLFLLTFLMFTKLSSNIQSSSSLSTNVSALIGKDCTVTKAIQDGQSGEVKVYGELWTALSKSGQSFERGQTLIIDDIDGTKLIVKEK